MDRISRKYQTLKTTILFRDIMNAAIKRVQTENRALNIPNVFEIKDRLYYCMPNGDYILAEDYIRIYGHR
jgi:hypothetical protein